MPPAPHLCTRTQLLQMSQTPTTMQTCCPRREEGPEVQASQRTPLWRQFLHQPGRGMRGRLAARGVCQSQPAPGMQSSSASLEFSGQHPGGNLWALSISWRRRSHLHGRRLAFLQKKMTWPEASQSLLLLIASLPHPPSAKNKPSICFF